jgi:hypothetical protein
MPQEDDETAKLEHGEEVGLVIFPTADQSAEIVKPGEQALDFPAAAVATQFAAVLRETPGVCRPLQFTVSCTVVEC